MKYMWPAGFLCLIMGSGLVHANELSKDYLKCSKQAFGEPKAVQKCINKELKIQNKYLKKYYKVHLKNAGEFRHNYEMQHQLWQKRVYKICGAESGSVHVLVRHSQCVLGFTAERATYYQRKIAGL